MVLGKGLECKAISHSTMLRMTSDSPLGMPETLSICPQKCGGGQKGGEEGQGPKSYAADRCRV